MSNVDWFRVTIVLAVIGFWALVLAALWIACRVIWP